MARLVIVAGPAFRPSRHLPPFCSPQWPGLSLWQVPPCSQHSQSSSIPSLYPTISQPRILGPACHCGRSRLTPNTPLHFHPPLYPTPVTPTVKARLVIVAGPALQPTPPLHFYPILIPTLVFPTFTARLVIVAGPASSVSPHPFLSLTPLFSHLLLSSTPIIIPIIWPGLSLWQVPPCSPSNSPRTSTLLDSPFNTLSFLRPGLSLWRAPPPHSHCLPLQLLLSLSSFTPSKSPACHCGRSRLIFLLYPSHHSVPSPLFLSLSSLAALRAPAAMGDPK